MAVTNATTERELVLNVSVKPHLMNCQFVDSLPDQQMAMINVDLLPNAPFKEVQVIDSFSY